jgi:hypothetical protein
MLLRLVESKPVFEVLLGRGELSQVQYRFPQYPMGL